MLKNIKRFFEPILIESIYFWRTILTRIIQSFAGVFNIFMIKDIISILELGNIGELSNYIWVYGVVNIILFILIFICRNWSWGESAQHIFKMIHRIYIKELNTIDNTYIENMGTGKIISIYSKGCYAWVTFILDFFEVSIKLLFSISASFILLYNIGNIYIISFFLVFVGVHIVIYFLNKKAIKWRKGRIDMMHEYDKQIVKIIMSKFEILQNNKIDKEIKVLDKYIDKAKYYNLGLNDYLITMINIPNVAFFVFSLGLLITFSKIDISFSIIISLFMILGLLKENMYSSINFFKNFTKDIYQIQKLWDLFDEAPRIKGLISGDDFIYKSGNIEIKDLNFSYGENVVFEKFSINMKGGHKIAFVGASGGGKTTLVKLISGFLAPNSGDIIIDGQNLAGVNLNGYYKKMLDLQSGF